MLYFILTLIGIGIIIEVLKAIGKALLWVGGIILCIIGVILLVVVIIHIGPVLLPFLPYVVFAGAVILVGVLIYRFISSVVKKIALKRLVHNYNEWLSTVGVGAYKDAPGNLACWNEAIRQRYAIRIDDDFAVSVPFIEALVSEVHRQLFLRQTDLFRIANSLAPEFRQTYIHVLMGFLKEKNQIQILTPQNRQRYCMVNDLLSIFEQILLDNDSIVTMNDFRKACSAFDELSFLQNQDKDILREVLRCISKSNDKLVVQRSTQLIKCAS